MGKNQYGANALYIRASERAGPGGRGGYKKANSHGGILPFNCCSLTFSPAKVPVALVEHSNCYIFDLANILPWLKKNKVNPVTGSPASISSLVRIKIHSNTNGCVCPVTQKLLNKSSHIVAIKVPGSTLSSSAGHHANVYAYEAVRELCIKSKKFIDPLSSLKFSMEDILLIQDPQNRSKQQDRSAFYHSQLEQKASAASSSASSSSTSSTTSSSSSRVVGARSSSGLLVNSSTARVFAELDAQRKAKEIKAKETAAATSSSSSSSSSSSTSSSTTTSKFSNGAVAGGFTSSSMAPTTMNVGSSTTLDALQVRWRRLKKMKQDGIVHLHTSHGTLVFRLFFSAAPAACDNFVQLCEQGYYDNVSFHRLIKNFMLQGGDPTGTGSGGKTAWQGVHRFPDDPFQQNPNTHSARGMLSMANSGPNTNGSQFFITFKATPHLDRKHVVFGVLTSGQEGLAKMESVPVNDKDAPLNKIVIISTEVKQKPIVQDKEQMEEAAAAAKAAAAAALIPVVRAKMTSSSVVGAFLNKGTGDSLGGVKRKRNSMPAKTSTGVPKSKKKGGGGGGGKKKKKKKFGGFSGW
jgi:peptidyl-prolyl cis-trans isomerase-like protein 2